MANDKTPQQPATRDFQGQNDLMPVNKSVQTVTGNDAIETKQRKDQARKKINLTDLTK